MKICCKPFFWLCAALAFVFTAAICTDAADAWTIHEWGTFTSLQNEQGDAIGGINTDDEPVPQFVHRLAQLLLLQPTEIPGIFCQGAPQCHPDVTMRLETPVIYFHPPKSETKTRTANVHVKFRGGWLTEFFPYADAVASDLRPDGYSVTNLATAFHPFGHLRADSESSLQWNDLQIGGAWPLTNTAAHVWTSPRAVDAASVQTLNGESEKFLFYRGVAHLDAPLRISRDAGTGELFFRGQLEGLPIHKPLNIRALWLVDIHSDGKIAFRSLPALSVDQNSRKILAHTPAQFAAGDFSSGNFEKLKSELKTALVSEGLFADEAQALLNTWGLSYFKSDGLRVFFLVPRAWTDHYLPLDISIPAEVRRVMVGRIELITPDQRLRLQEIARFSTASITNEAVKLRQEFYASPAVSGDEWQRLYYGKKPLSAEVSVPKTYQTYLDLGRFRNALILDEAQQSAASGLTNFISTYALEAYRPR